MESRSSTFRWRLVTRTLVLGRPGQARPRLYPQLPQLPQSDSGRFWPPGKNSATIFSMKTRRGKIVVVVAAGGVLAVLLAGLVYWPEIQVRYEVDKLRSDPNYVFQLLDEPQETPKGKAVSRFLEGGPGDRNLLTLISEYNTVVVGTVERVDIRPPGNRFRLSDWAVTVKVGEVLRGKALPSGSIVLYVHSPIIELGLDVNNLPDEPMVWLLNVLDTEIDEFCWHLDSRFNPRDVETFRKVIDKLNGGDGREHRRG